MTNLKELHALATRAVGPHATGFAAQCAADEFSARVFPEDILSLLKELRKAKETIRMLEKSLEGAGR